MADTEAFAVVADWRFLTGGCGGVWQAVSVFTLVVGGPISPGGKLA